MIDSKATIVEGNNCVLYKRGMTMNLGTAVRLLDV